MRSLLPWKYRKSLYEQASSQLENELTVTQVLDGFSARLLRRNNKKAAAAVSAIHRHVRNGKTLVDAMGSGLMDIERSVLEAGEKASSLPDAMRLVLEVHEMTARLRQKMLASFFAPAVYLVTLYAVLLVIGVDIVPQFADALPLEKWTGWAYVMYLMGQLAVGWVAPVVLGALVAYVAVSWYALSRWRGPLRAFFDRHFFPFTAYREIVGLTWLLTFVALLRAGISDTSGLEGQIATASPWMASRLRPIRMGLNNGLALDDAMRLSRFGFPSLDLIDEVGAFSGFKDFPVKLDAVTRNYAKAFERKLLVKGSLISGVFSGVMFAAFAVVQLGANSLSSILSSSMGHM